jgi:hypothetical protein
MGETSQSGLFCQKAIFIALKRHFAIVPNKIQIVCVPKCTASS